jgi:hypothetical protein
LSLTRQKSSILTFRALKDTAKLKCRYATVKKSCTLGIGEVIENEYLFDWASTRIEPNIIKLSFSKNVVQKLYKFSWDGKTLESAIENAQSFYRKNF